MSSDMNNFVPALAAYDVFLNGERIDTVFFHKGTTVSDVWDKLVMHDMYDPNITVEEVK